MTASTAHHTASTTPAATPPANGDGRGTTRGAELVLTGLGKSLGGRVVVDGLDLTVRAGELLCLLGPSGCGKTTTLRMIGGFVRPDTGSVILAGRDLTALSPDRRPTAMVFQSYALWPHMTVAGNVAFGLRVHRVPRAEVIRRVDEALAMVSLTHHRDSYPARISGGEQQRVALARALVLRPEVLLLDEPLSNLDARLRVRVRDEIRTLQQELGITTVLVTHDQDEALSVSDRVAVMNGGRIEQVATPRQLYRYPRTRFVAEFVGAMNLLEGSVGSRAAMVGGVSVPVEEPVPTAVAVDVGIRPEDVRLGVPGSGGATGTVVREVPRGAATEIVVELGDCRLRALVGGDVDSGASWPDGRVDVRFTRVSPYTDTGLLRTP